MKWHRFGYFAFLAFVGIGLLTAPAASVRKSHGCFGGGGGNCGGGGLCGGLNGANGVVIDAQGVLHNEVFEDPNGNLQRERNAAARAKLEKRVAASSKLRKISLNRLEAALAARLDQRMPPTEEMLYLAGLTRVHYVFFYPDTRDIVLAGPAEAWAADLAGRVRGLESGWTTLQLQDLIVALRAYPPGKQGTPMILVSIDPTAEGLGRMQQFLRSVGSQATPDQTDFIVNGLHESLGMQNIRVEGIAPNTHFAQVLIEADYRMKLIGIGLERPPVRIKSYVDAANPSQVSRSALQRWYFVPDYKCVRVAKDELGMELVGNGVKLVGEDQVVAKDGSRAVGGRTNKASQTFVNGFTQKYAELAMAVACVCGNAQLRRSGRGRGLHPAAQLLRQSRLALGSVWQRAILSGRDLQCAAAHRHGRGQRVARQSLDDPGGRRRDDASQASFGRKQPAARRRCQSCQGPRKRATR